MGDTATAEVEGPRMNERPPPYGKMIQLSYQNGLYIVKAPKCTLVMTKAELIQALRRGKWWKRQDTRQAWEVTQ
jgi:hypothetical protein